MINFKELLKNKQTLKATEMKRQLIKTIIVVNLLLKNNRNFRINVYNNFVLENGLEVDLYYEDLAKKEVKIYKIFNNADSDLAKKVKTMIKDYEIPYIVKTEYIFLSMDKLPNNFGGLQMEVEGIINLK